MNLSQITGFLGTALVILAYAPQITHLVRERCSAGISRPAFVLWLSSSLLLLVHALLIRDIVFTLLQGLNAVATVLILVFASLYRDGRCASHGGPLRGV